MFVMNNMDLYHMTSQIHGLNARRNLDLYCPQKNLTIYQRNPYYFDLKLFNHLPLNIKELAQDTKQFSKALNAFLHSKSLYTVAEYFNCNCDGWLYKYLELESCLCSRCKHCK
jgi:hypothetical protein